jgi:hypothetical protein
VDDETETVCANCGDPATRITDDDVELCAACFAAVPRESVPRPVAVGDYKPGTRQPAAAPAKVTGEPPWWAKTKPGEMTKTAEEHRQRMASSKEAKGAGVHQRLKGCARC